jgi:hypothetical protein
MPAFKKFIEMPPPIVPAPITATFSTLRFGVSSGTSGILLAARSAKNAWRSALHSGVSISPLKSSSSYARPSSIFIVTEACTASTHLGGAGKFLAIAFTVLRANWKYASAFGCEAFRSRTRGSGRLSVTDLANAIAAATTSPSAI